MKNNKKLHWGKTNNLQGAKLQGYAVAYCLACSKSSMRLPLA
jgi:hypothetical protein